MLHSFDTFYLAFSHVSSNLLVLCCKSDWKSINDHKKGLNINALLVNFIPWDYFCNSFGTGCALMKWWKAGVFNLLQIRSRPSSKIDGFAHFWTFDEGRLICHNLSIMFPVPGIKRNFQLKGCWIMPNCAWKEKRAFYRNLDFNSFILVFRCIQCSSL